MAMLEEGEGNFVPTNQEVEVEVEAMLIKELVVHC